MRHSYPASGFVWQYENWIEFDREVTISVDSVFARLAAKDGDVRRAVDDFRSPAYGVLSDKYGIQLLWGELKADSQSGKFILKTPNTDWTDDLKHPDSPLLTLPPSHPLGVSYRWRAYVIKAEVEFTSLSPKRVFVHAEMFVEMQERLSMGQWKNIQVSDAAVKRVGDSLRKDLNRAYYRYMKDRYGFEITSSRFGGFNE